MLLNNIGKQITKLKIRENKITIKFIDQSKIVSPLDCLTKYKLKEGKILTNEEYKKISEESSIYEGILYIERISQRHLYSSNEIKQKLIKRHYHDNEIKKIIKNLEIRRLINDDEFIQAFVSRSNAKNRSIARIKHELIVKGISLDKVHKIKSSYDNELKKAKHILDYKLNILDSFSYNEKKNRLANSLRLQMFSESIIKDCLNDNLTYSYNEEMKHLRKEYSIAFSKYRFRYLGDLLYEKVIEYLLKKGYSFNDIKLIEKEYKDETCE